MTPYDYQWSNGRNQRFAASVALESVLDSLSESYGTKVLAPSGIVTLTGFSVLAGPLVPHGERERSLVVHGSCIETGMTLQQRGAHFRHR